MTRSLLGVLMLCSLTLSASDDLRLTPLDAWRGAGPEVDVIVELADPPALRSREPRAAATKLDTLVDRFEADLNRIEKGIAGRGPVANAAVARRVRFEYKLTFAGASTRMSREALPAVRALPYVKAVHLDRELEAHVSKSVPHIRAREVWERYGTRGEGLVIAIIDTGIDYTHKSLGGGFGPGFKVAGGHDFANDDADPMDDNGHGTHVAGIAAGDTAPVLGVAPAATLFAYKVLDAEGRGSASAILAGIERAVDPNDDGDPSDRVDVINMSLGGPRILGDPLVAAVERATAAGVVVVLSAGNRNLPGSVGSPALAPSAITVGATFLDDRRSAFSSQGPLGGTWAVKPEVAAPGVDISSAKMGGGTLRAHGTSMAAPHVAGVAALLLEKHPDWSPADVKAAIVSTAKAAYFHNPDESGHRESVLAAGGGRVDARAAIEATVLPSPVGVSFGLVRRHGLAYTSTRTVKLVNRGSEGETLTVTVPALPDSTTLTVTPMTVTIPRDGSADITMTLTLPPQTPGPNESDAALAGLVTLTGTKTALRVPWQVVTGAVMEVTFAGEEDVAALIWCGRITPVPWPTGPRTMMALTPLDADVMAYFTANGEHRVVMREQVPPSGFTALTVSPEEAKFNIQMLATDENGVAFETLAAAGATNLFQQAFLLRGYVPIRLADAAGNPNLPDMRELWVSPMTHTRLRTTEILLKPGAAYATMYPLLYGVQQSETAMVGPDDWARQTIEHRCETPGCEVYFLPGAASVFENPWYRLPNGPSTWKLFLTKRVSEEYDFRAYLAVREEGWKPPAIGEQWTYLSPPFRYEGGRIAASPVGRATPVADYFSPSVDRPIATGYGPMLLRTAVGDEAFIRLDPFGAAIGETPGTSELIAMKTKLFDAAGNEVVLAPTGNPRVFRRPSEQGPYRLEASIPYRIAGRDGLVSQTVRFDPKVWAMSATLTMMRIEDGGGTASWTLPANTRARLFFAGRNSALADDWYPLHKPIDPAATRAWWRPHGSTAEWQPLNVATIGSDYREAGNLPGAPGTFFVADLAAATAMPGAVDIKILLVNARQGTAEVTFAPALIVTEPQPKRRAVR